MMVVESLPMVVRAEYRGGYRIWLAFNDGIESTVDFADWLAGPVFEPLKEPGYFERFSWTAERSRGPTARISRRRRSMSERGPARPPEFLLK